MCLKRCVFMMLACLLIATTAMGAGSWSNAVDTEWTNADNWDSADYPEGHAFIQDSWSEIFPVIGDGQDYEVEILSFNWFGGTPGYTAEMTIEDGGKMSAPGWITLNQGGLNTEFHEAGDVEINVELGGELNTTNMMFGVDGSSATVNVDGSATFAILDMKDGDNEIVIGDHGYVWALTDWWGPELDGIDNDLLLNDKIVAANPDLYVDYHQVAEDWTILAAVPEPATVFLLGIGSLALLRKRK